MSGEGAMLEVTLSCGGSIRLTVSGDLFALTGDERTFVFGLVDTLKAFGGDNVHPAPVAVAPVTAGGSVNLTCPTCQATAKSTSGLAAHMRSHEPRTPCPRCGKPISTTGAERHEAACVKNAEEERRAELLKCDAPPADGFVRVLPDEDDDMPPRVREAQMRDAAASARLGVTA